MVAELVEDLLDPTTDDQDWFDYFYDDGVTVDYEVVVGRCVNCGFDIHKNEGDGSNTVHSYCVHDFIDYLNSSEARP